MIRIRSTVYQSYINNKLLNEKDIYHAAVYLEAEQSLSLMTLVLTLVCHISLRRIYSVNSSVCSRRRWSHV